MKKFVLFFLLLISCSCFAAEAKLKTLILIIATDDKPAFRDLQKVWESYMNSDPTHFEAYFIRGNPKLDKPFVINMNEIIVKTEEGYAPGILNKTILAMQAMEPRLNEFDYILRTNLSSFFPFANLLAYEDKLPREKCYCGIAQFHPKGWNIPGELDTIPYISGAGIILSRDLAKLLIKDSNDLEKYKGTMPDDVFIGLFFQRKGIPTYPAQRWDYPTYAGWLEFNHLIEDYAYHFRAKNNYEFRTSEDPYKDELLTLKALVKRYYNKDVQLK
jgi:hypothetical protein